MSELSELDKEIILAASLSILVEEDTDLKYFAKQNSRWVSLHYMIMLSME